MKPLLGLTFAAILLVLAGVAYDRFSAPSLHPVAMPAPHGDAAPKVTFHDASGKALHVGGISSPYVLVHFWATWCAPCKEELPVLAGLAATYGDKLTILAVSVDDASVNVDRYLAQFDAATQKNFGRKNMMFLRDEQQVAARAYQSYRYPESYLLGPERTIRRKFVGAVQPRDFSLQD